MATSTVTVLDPETMSMDDLRKAAEAEALAASTKKEDTKEEVKEVVVKEEAEEKTEVVKPKTYFRERTIDLGDGAGVQVFKGKGATSEEALEDLTDKLADAQRNATKKIRELNAKAKTEVKTSPEDDALYSAELLKSPTEAFKKLFKATTGVDIGDFTTTHQKEKAFLAAQERQRIGNEFVAAHPDFADTPRNGKLINKWLQLHNDFSSESFEKAYQDLNESGLLDVKGEEASVEQKEDKSETRIERKTEDTSSQRTRKASGLSTQRRTAVPPPTQPTEAELYKMPMDELRRLANKQLAAN